VLLQAEALLSETRVDYVRADTVDTWLQRLQKLLMGMPERIVEQPPDGVAEYLQKLGMPQVHLPA
jgi:hypothetical protein